MFPEFGSFLLSVGLCVSIVQSCYFFLMLCKYFSIATLPINLSLFTIRLTFLNFVSIFFSVMCLFYLFASDDFSVLCVANNSNSYLPFIYKLSSFWSCHEGSLLLFLFFMVVWMCFVACGLFCSDVVDVFVYKFRACIVSVMSGICVCFYVFLLFTSNPFSRIVLNQPIDGSDLNPLLQDIGLILHPPVLYFSYGGFSTIFSFSIAILIFGFSEKYFFYWIRSYLLISWGFLSFGIALGSWWAYYELGWGGWWFWDPVENVSLMPWLISTALIHVLFLVRKKNLFIRYVLLFSLCIFSLCLFGTFIVRSGFLPSVHSFVSDSSRSFVLLCLLVLIIGGAFLLYIFRIYKFVETGNMLKFGEYNKEFLLTLVSFFLISCFFVVFIGTIYPLCKRFFFVHGLSINPTYFNFSFIPLFYCCFSLLPFSLYIPLFPNFLKYFILCIYFFNTLCFFYFFFSFNFKSILYNILIIGIFVFFNFLLYFIGLYRKFFSFYIIFRFIKQHFIMLISHCGLVITVFGIMFSSLYSIEKDMICELGEKINLGKFTVIFNKVNEVEGNNYVGYKGSFFLEKNNFIITEIKPEKRVYLNSGLAVSEVSIYPTFFYDVYIGLGEPLGLTKWSCRIQYKPLIRWIWLGFVLMFIGSFNIFIVKFKNR